MICLYSIGHSSHDISGFVNLLKMHKIETVVDIRRAPYSGRYPHFNKKELEESLTDRGFKYVYMGDKLGGLKGYFGSDRRIMEQKDYEKLAGSEAFTKGIDMLIELAGKSRTAIMCSEGDPEKCHRTFLIAPALFAKDVTITHILPDGKLISAQKGLFD